ncbi:hypothetical protein L202_00988 [Cryptococcus amylolentus CBS 6039]|uniref:Uncharacterized protein n=1 Tax=Cryptococcus amylolentus CBS 6039 TaxID=1295533 RepID=A0A1E3I4A5_9TREE|nr:hypothetical protein L202_00988 [Cryptococcus amylolentus CBS 6039]ODN82696.1 hypothetical protein L202_00988 [Cryptococcus amylolentus CBS 6039]
MHGGSSCPSPSLLHHRASWCTPSPSSCYRPSSFRSPSQPSSSRSPYRLFSSRSPSHPLLPQYHQSQPQARTLWQRINLLIPMAVAITMFMSAACLAVGAWQEYDHPTVAGSALTNYAGPGLWVIGAFLSFPGLIAA